MGVTINKNVATMRQAINLANPSATSTTPAASTTTTPTVTTEDAATASYIFNMDYYGNMSFPIYTAGSVVNGYMETVYTNGVPTSTYIVVAGYQIPTNYLSPYVGQSQTPYINNSAYAQPPLYYQQGYDPYAQQPTTQPTTDNSGTTPATPATPATQPTTDNSGTTPATPATPATPTAGTTPTVSKSIFTTKNMLIAAAVIVGSYFLFFAKKPIIKIKK